MQSLDFRVEVGADLMPGRQEYTELRVRTLYESRAYVSGCRWVQTLRLGSKNPPSSGFWVYVSPELEIQGLGFRVWVGVELTLGQQESAKQHMQQEDEPGQGVSHHNGAGQGSNEAKQGQGILVCQHEQEHEAEEPAGNNMCHQSISAHRTGAWIYNHLSITQLYLQICRQQAYNILCIHISAMVLGCSSEVGCK